jgi:aerotolerance regulator-like protein
LPFSFLNPVFLWGALAAVIPLALHFWRRRLARDVKFSDLRFLKEIQANQARSMGVKRLLLLILRMLIIVLIALAAAGPRFSGLASGGGRVSLLILLDGSASMKTRQTDQSRFDAALQQALEMGRSLSANSEVQMLRVSSGQQPLFAGWTPSHLLRDVDLSRVRPDDTSLDLPGGPARSRGLAGALAQPGAGNRSIE